uniref:Uncharacterized protein n=1 Tax=Solanum lycopersicum TaxID=4081 RepID=A0A3Q7FKF1_SOLLC
MYVQQRRVRPPILTSSFSTRKRIQNWRIQLLFSKGESMNQAAKDAGCTVYFLERLSTIFRSSQSTLTVLGGLR